MAEITAITLQAKDKERCNVYVDGKFYCGMKLETVLSCRLKAGDVIDPARLDEIQLENEKAQALDRALTHLSVTMKTEKEMSDFLHKKGYVDAVCEYVLEKLRTYSYVDDAEYCAQYVRSAGKGKGARLMRAELVRRGVREECIDEALSSLTGEAEAARQVAQKYMKGKEFTRENLSKAYRRLLSRGFDYDTAKSALASLGAEEDDA